MEHVRTRVLAAGDSWPNGDLPRFAKWRCLSIATYFLVLLLGSALMGYRGICRACQANIVPRNDSVNTRRPKLFRGLTGPREGIMSIYSETRKDWPTCSALSNTSSSTTRWLPRVRLPRRTLPIAAGGFSPARSPFKEDAPFCQPPSR